MNYHELSKRLETISGITVTPFDPKTKEINWEGVKENIEFLIDHGLEVIVPCGNTSEFYALTLEEAKEEIRQVVEIVNGRAFVLAGLGYSVKTAVELGNFAKEVGADGIMIHMPIHPYMTNRGAVTYFKEIIESVDLPAVVYFKDPHISDDVLKELTSLEKLIGVKYSINDLPRFAKLVRETPKEHNITWVCGTAEKWAPFFWNAGAKGFTSGLVNIHPKKSFELLEALRNKEQNKVWEVWSEVLAFEDMRAKYNNGNNVVVIKEAMELVGLTAGVTREPVDPLDANDKDKVKEIVASWGMLTR